MLQVSNITPGHMRSVYYYLSLFTAERIFLGLVYTSGDKAQTRLPFCESSDERLSHVQDHCPFA